MSRTFTLVSAALLIAGAAATLFPTSNLAHAPKALVDQVTARSIRSHTQFLSSADLEGRLTTTRGERIAAQYAAASMRNAGLSPAGDTSSDNTTSWYQSIEIRTLKMFSKSNMTIAWNSGATASLSWYNDWAGFTWLNQSSISLSEAELVFVGYGIQNPEIDWDDYKGVDVGGKIVVALLGQPSTGVWASQGSTWESREGGKREAAAQNGAAGIVFLNRNVVYINSASASATMCPASFLGEPLTFYGWIAPTYAAMLATGVGKTLTALATESESANFTPYSLGARITLSATYNITTAYGTSAVGMIRGRFYPNEVVVVSGHIDHAGFDNYGRVLPGCLDNAAGAAIALTTAEAFGHQFIGSECGAERPFNGLSRSVVFLFSGAEESGLWGAYTYIAKAKAAGIKIVANINWESPGAWGKTTDLTIIGMDQSTMGTVVAPFACAGENLNTTADPLKSQGFIYRGDQWAFIQNDIPAVWIGAGIDYVGQSSTYWYTKLVTFLTTCYHQYCDKYSESMDFTSMVQQGRAGIRAVYAVAASKYTPTVLW